MFRGIARYFSGGVTRENFLPREKNSLGFAKKCQMFSQICQKMTNVLPGLAKTAKVSPGFAKKYKMFSKKKQSAMTIFTLPFSITTKIHCAWPKKGFFLLKKMEKIFFSSINVGLLSKKRRRIHDF